MRRLLALYPAAPALGVLQYHNAAKFSGSRVSQLTFRFPTHGYFWPGIALSEGNMRRIWFGLALAALLVAKPALAQDYHKNFVECTKELGLQPDVGTQKLSDGRVLRRWYLHNEAQQIAFSDCVARKASLAAKPSTKGPSRVSQ
jgi:hypothetical protein